MPTKGYVYCFSNACMPDLLKIGMTKRNPSDRLKDANMGTTWMPQCDVTFKIEFAKEVDNPRQKERELHTALANVRAYSNREFFRISIEEAKAYFDTIEGEYWASKELIEETMNGKVKSKPAQQDMDKSERCKRCFRIFPTLIHLGKHIIQEEQCGTTYVSPDDYVFKHYDKLYTAMRFALLNECKELNVTPSEHITVLRKRQEQILFNIENTEVDAILLLRYHGIKEYINSILLPITDLE